MFSIQIRGFEAINRKLRRLGQELEDTRVANAKSGEVIVRRARVHCPVKTGRLQGSIRVKSIRGGCTVVASEGIIYGPVQHWGWPAHNIRATLFMSKGFAEARPECLAIYDTEIAKMVHRA